MSPPVAKPWAILLCRYNDDTNDPATTRVMDLAEQWRRDRDQQFIDENLSDAWDTDERTLLDLYTAFFTVNAVLTFNLVHYFDTMSHGQIDMTGNQVFPCTLDLAAAEAPALGSGFVYQSALFKKAKQALKDTHGVDWKSFSGGVIVSFQSPDFGAQGYKAIDGGPGVFMDVRYVVNDGTRMWGHEVGHGFGLGHSRTDGIFTSPCSGGDPSDYMDPWDIMSVRCAFSAPDPHYRWSGPGMNAWNMRYIHGLDESRVWRLAPVITLQFTHVLQLRPLHDRQKPGFLAAELPGIGGQSAYLIEHRVPTLWDAGFGKREVIVHRFKAPNAYVMRTTKGNQTLGVGDTVLIGTGPAARVRVLAFDAVNDTATVELTFSPQAIPVPAVKIGMRRNAILDPCAPNVPVVGTIARFDFDLTDVPAGSAYQIMWSVTGASPVAGQSNSAAEFDIVTPDPSIQVTISVRIFLEDGSQIADDFTFNAVSQATAKWMRVLCELSHERMFPVPPWEWDPWKLRDVTRPYSNEQLTQIEARAMKLVETIRKVRELRD